MAVSPAHTPSADRVSCRQGGALLGSGPSCPDRTLGPDPATLLAGEFWWGACEDGGDPPAYSTLPVETIAALKRRCPAIRVFVSLRNPFERAWSAAMMDLTRSLRLVEETPDAWFEAHFRSAASKARGDYVGMLERWWQVLPAELLLVSLHDDIMASPLDLLRRLALHLQIDPCLWPDSPEGFSDVIVPRLSVPSEYKRQQGGPIRPALRPLLRALYGPTIERLGSMLGRDLQHWVRSLDESGTSDPRLRQEINVGGGGDRFVRSLLAAEPAARAAPGPVAETHEGNLQ